MEIDTNALVMIIGRKQIEIEVLREQNQGLIKLVRRQEAALSTANNIEGETDGPDRTATD